MSNEVGPMGVWLILNELAKINERLDKFEIILENLEETRPLTAKENAEL